MSASAATTSEEIQDAPVFKLRLSTEDDLEAIDQIIKDGVEAIRVQGFDQWQDGYPNLTIIRDDQAQDRSYVLERIQPGATKGDVVGIATIYTLGEPAYLTLTGGQWSADLPYACLHRVAVSAQVYGQGVALKLILACEEECRKKGFTYMRIDTHEENQPMLVLLQKKAGYKKVGVVCFKAGDLGASDFERVALDKML